MSRKQQQQNYLATGSTEPTRNGRLRIPLPFDEAMKAAVEVKPSKSAKNRKKK